MFGYRLFILFFAFGGSCSGYAFGEKVEIVLDEVEIPNALQVLLADTLPDFNAPESRLEARRHARRGAQIAKDILNSEGYFAPTIEAGVPVEPPFSPVLRINPGARFTVDQIVLDYSNPAPLLEDQDVVRGTPSTASGDIAVPENLLIVRTEITQKLRALGYPDVEVDKPALLADRKTGQVNVDYGIRSGYHAVFGKLIIPDGLRTRPEYIEHLSTIEPGTLYDPAKLSTLIGRLSVTRHFDIASATLAPVTASPSQAQLDITRDVVLNLQERDRHTIALGGTISTDEGPGLSTEWTRRNLTGRTDPLTVRALLALREQSLGLNWDIPNIPKPGRSLALRGRVFNENTDAFNRTGASTGASFEVARTNQTVFTFGGEAEFVQERGEAENRFLTTLSGIAAARTDRSNDILNPTDGWRANIAVEPGVSFGSDNAQFFRTSGQVTKYQALDSKARWVAAARLRVGAILGADTDDLPVDRRFFSGGGSSVRGFGFQEVGPRDVEGNPVGGRGLLETSAELRFQATKSIGIVGFVDAGNISDQTLPRFNDVRFGAGLGLRYLTPAGPIRLDIATPINSTEFDSSVQVYFSIGQAF